MSESRAITPIHENRDLDVQRDPSAVLATAINAAKVLKDVIAKKARPVIINKETYLEFEDWQTLGQFYGYAVRTLAAEPVEIHGVQGAKAKAELIDFRTGEVVGGAEAYCMGDEDKWKGRDWYQLASMAQTRAGAKAFRNRLAWIVVLAGYRPTPAEEMTDQEGPRVQREPEHFCPIHKMAFRQQHAKDGSRTWYSHKAPDGTWCNEDKLPKVDTTPEPEPIFPDDVPLQARNLTPDERALIVKNIRSDAKELMISDEQLDDFAIKYHCQDFETATDDVLDKIARRLAKQNGRKGAE